LPASENLHKCGSGAVELVPRTARFAVLVNPAGPLAKFVAKDAQAALLPLGGTQTGDKKASDANVSYHTTRPLRAKDSVRSS
jgi:hypothetical protein